MCKKSTKNTVLQVILYFSLQKIQQCETYNTCCVMIHKLKYIQMHTVYLILMLHELNVKDQLEHYANHLILCSTAESHTDSAKYSKGGF